MGGKSEGERTATREAGRAQRRLDKETKRLKDLSEKEARKSQRFLIRSSRAAGGGFFESDDAGAKDPALGGSGDLG